MTAVWTVVTLFAVQFLHAEEKIGGWVNVSLEQRYVGLRVSRVIHDKPMLWTDVGLTLPKGFTAGLWYSQALDEKSPNFGNEIDIWAEWQNELPHDYSISFGSVYFILTPLDELGKDNIADHWIRLNKSFGFGKHTLTPEIRAEWMWTTPDFDDGSVILMPNVRHVWSEPLSINRLTLDHTMMTVWDDGFKFAGNSSKGVFARWYGGLHWRLTENVSIRLPGWTVLAPITDPGDGRKFATSINTGITFSF